MEKMYTCILTVHKQDLFIYQIKYMRLEKFNKVLYVCDP